ncbi:MAG: hypothetical protein ACRDIC_06060 [bacterium]
MKRTIAILVITATLGFGSIAVAPPVRAAQVFCRVPTLHKVVCWNYTPYRVWMNVTVRTSAGPRYFAFWNNYTKWVKYFVPVVYSVNWRWHF